MGTLQLIPKKSQNVYSIYVFPINSLNIFCSYLIEISLQQNPLRTQ